MSDTPSSPAASRRYAGASAAERQTQRRERLLEAAFDVFGRMGYRNTTMRLICAQARLTERYFYESFQTVDEVFLAVHKRQSAAIAQQVMILVAQEPTDPVRQMRAGLTGFFEYIKADPRRAQILLLDAVTAGLTNPRNLNARVSLITEIVRERLRKRYPNLTQALDVDLVVGGFVGMVVHTASIWTERKFETPIEVLVDHNAYAWAGLHQWLSSQGTTGAAPPGQNPVK
jgi:AcrR family transcriptional regulator